MRTKEVVISNPKRNRIIIEENIMKKLSNEQYNRAKTFMKTQAADIDLAMFEFFFEDKPIESVLQILYRYQDECGGFSKLEYDMEYPLVCLKHTESACLIS